MTSVQSIDRFFEKKLFLVHKNAPRGIRTHDTRFKVWGANHYTMGAVHFTPEKDVIRTEILIFLVFPLLLAFFFSNISKNNYLK